MTANFLTQTDNRNLHLVDFNDVTPEQLKAQIETAINAANRFLDTLSCADEMSAKAALDDIIAFDHLNLTLDRAWGILSHLNSVMSDDNIRQTHHDVLPLLSAFGTRVGQSKPLFYRYQKVAADKEFFANLDDARARAITLAIQSFELSGVGLQKDEQEKFADIQRQLSQLSATFSDHILDATQAFSRPLSDEELAGIPESGLALLADAGETFKQNALATNLLSQAKIDALPTPYYVATLNIPVYLTVMIHADDRKLREALYYAYVTRASEFDAHKNAKGESLNNAPMMSDILALRAQKAKLLGFDNFAALSLSTKMAESVAEVESFLRNLAKKATPAAKADLAKLQDCAAQFGIDNIQPWDTAYLAEKVKQDSFSLSQEVIRAYFPLPTVIEGLFSIVQRLYGIRVQQKDVSEGIAKWHDEVMFYELYDNDDSLIGGFYFDLFARNNKRGGAWMSGFQSRYELDSSYRQLPVCFMVANFTPPLDGKPSLLTHDEVTTLFHEFGHGLHHLLTQVSVGDVAGVNGVEWDAVELPSQFMENWAWDAEGIALISGHVETGEPLPKDKLEALLAAKNFQSGLQTLRQIEFALFDLLIHADAQGLDYDGILATLNQVRADIAILPTPDYNRFANGFSHIFAGGYAAGYYSYKWAELLSADAFSKFEEEGIFNPATGKAFRETILAVGGSHPAKTNFENFRGRPASIEALLRHSGFEAHADNDANHAANDTKAS